MGTFFSCRIGGLVTFKTGKLDSNASVLNGRYPFFTCSQETFHTNTYSFDGEYVLLAGNNANGIFPLKYFVGKFDAYQRTYVIKSSHENNLVTKFLYYALKLKLDEFRVFSTGAATKFLTLTILNNTEIPLPPLPVQRRIAGILSAYDDLIENNQRRIAVLERMARSLYREWFVHFRYPGHEGVPLVDSALGPIPQGWEVKRLGDLTTYLNRGLAPSYDDGGNSVIINQKCIRDQRLNLEPARRQSKLIPLEKKVKFGDVLINSTGVGTLGRVAQVYQRLEEYTVDTHVTIARPNTETNLDFFGCTVLSFEETFDRLGVGATGQTELSRTSISNVDLVVPPKFIQGEFGNIVHSIRMDVMTYTNQTQNLRRTRDLLLPRLLSGQLDVGAVE